MSKNQIYFLLFDSCKRHKYEEIQKQNPDFFGWVQMDSTELDCPVIRSDEDNEKYLHADFYGNYSYAGTPFVDNNCTRDSDNILIYGHKLRDGSVFRSLLNDGEKAYWQEYPTIMFSDLYADYEYEVMAAFYDRVYSSKEPGFRYYQFTDVADEEEFNYAINKYKEKFLYDTGVDASCGDKLITLSTCVYIVKQVRIRWWRMSVPRRWRMC